MAIENECGGTRSNTVGPTGNGDTVNPFQLKDQFPSSPKARKPYTITKQRERWTEEEHRKFIEAIKLHGRAWRRIEEYVGTKTAVQIRSHAQKFFSKVGRESGGSNVISVEPIEIPPPRPKRKPTHPYPRKLIHSVHTAILEHPPPNSDQDNQSPTSVLSAVGSTESDTTNCSLSPVSRDGVVHLRITEENGSPSPASDESKVQKWSFTKEAIQPEGRSLKLFGRTVFVTDPSNIKEDKIVQPIPWNIHSWSPGVLVMQFGKENTSGSGISMPWWIQLPFHSQDAEDKKEGSSTGSNSGVENVEGDPLSSHPRRSFDLRLGQGKGFVPYKKQDSESQVRLSL